MDLVRAVVDETNSVIGGSHPRLLYEKQLANAVESIAANIREAYGRQAGGERNQFLRYARASAEESTEHLRANFAARRIQPTIYWRIRNRLVLSIRMIVTLMR